MKYVVEEVADRFTEGSFDIKILFLPVAHPELNPMEMVWGTVKRCVASNNRNFRQSEVEELTRVELERHEASKFVPFVLHVMKEEHKYRRVSPIFEQLDDIVGEVEYESSSDSDISPDSFEKR